MNAADINVPAIVGALTLAAALQFISLYLLTVNPRGKVVLKRKRGRSSKRGVKSRWGWIKKRQGVSNTPRRKKIAPPVAVNGRIWGTPSKPDTKPPVVVDQAQLNQWMADEEAELADYPKRTNYTHDEYLNRDR